LGRSDRAWLAASWIKKSGQLRPFGLEKLEAKKDVSLFYIFFLKPKYFQNYFKYPFRQTKISVNHTEPKIQMLQHECKTCV
jgi:hypothetical protein